MSNSLKKQWFLDKRIYLLIFAIPFIIMYFVYAAFNVHPYGDNSVLVLDLNGQYVYYYEALRDALWGDSSLIYSWSRNLSGEMLGIYAYYLASPFTIIPMILPRSMMLGALELMQLMKIGAAAVTFAVYLKNQRKTKVYTTIIFSILYSLSSYTIVQLMNPMWLDGVIYLPLIIMGVERLIDKGTIAGFTIPLALTFLANYYIGYMTGFFVVIYFIYYIFSREDLPKVKKIVTSVLKALIGAVVAVLIAMVILLPAYNSLKLGKFEFTQPDYTLKTQFTIEQFFVKLMPFSYDTVKPEGLPFVFCGGLSVLLLPLFYLNKNISTKKKAANSVLLVAMFLCMYLSTVDIAWHGFQVPNWLPFRYSFMFSFVMLIIAVEAFEHLEGITMREIAASFFGILVFLFYIESRKYSFFTAINSVLTSCCVMVAYYVIITCMKKYRSATCSVIAVIAVSTEMFIVALYTLDRIDADVVYSKFSSYQQYVADGRQAVSMIEEADDGLYRSEKTYHRTVNDPMAFGLKGISHSSSTMNSKVINMLGYLGFTSRGHYTRYTGATQLTDSLLGVKYILDKDNKVFNYPKVMSYKDINIYKNPNALSIGYMVDEGITNAVIGTDNPFDNQDMLLSAMLGNDGTDTVFKRIMPEYVDYENITVENAGSHIKYSPTVKGLNAHIEFTLTAQSDDVIYAFFPSYYERTMNVWVNHEFIDVFYESDNYCIIPLGKFTKGETISVITTPTKDDCYMIDQYFYYLDKQMLDSSIAVLKENQWNIKSFSDTKIEGSITAKADQIMFTTIPYEKGWTIKIDGEKVEPVILLDSLIGIKVPEGTHEVTMNFMPGYLIEGIIISISGIVLLGVIIFIEKRSKKLLLNKLND